MPFSNHSHGLKATDYDLRRSKRLEPQHCPAKLFDGSMVLLDDVIQIFILTNLDLSAFVVIISFDASSVGATFVDIDFYWFVI